MQSILRPAWLMSGLLVASLMAMSVTGCSSSSDGEVVSGHVYASACVAGRCIGLAVPEVLIVLTRNGKAVAHGVTDVNGFVKMTVKGAGVVTITGTSAFLAGGGFTNQAPLSGEGAYGMDTTVPIASGITPGP